MLLRTKIVNNTFPFSITYGDKMLSLGSCFSVNIAKKLMNLGYATMSNPSGITFNPLSLLCTIQMVSGRKSLHRDQLFYQNELWSHPDYHGSFNHMEKEACFKGLNDSIETATTYLNDVSVTMVTLGTCKVYVDKGSGKVVNNCHKRPADHFTERLLSVKEVSSALSEIRQLIQGLSSKKVRFILSVSPVRHVKNGLVMDQRSKSTALLAVHELVDNHDDCHYFPAYELLTDELRDYRFYAEDMVHPSSQAVEYVFEKFETALLEPSEADLRKSVLSIQQRRQHKALFKETAAHQRFLEKLEADTKIIKEKHPFLLL